MKKSTKRKATATTATTIIGGLKELSGKLKRAKSVDVVRVSWTKETLKPEPAPDAFLEFLKGIGVDPTYIRKIVPRVEWQGTPYVDVYAFLDAYDVRCPAVQHAVKKLLCAGQRGVKSRLQDLKESKTAIERAIEMEERR